MNTLASGLIWGGVQVSVLVIAGSLVYAVVRRLGPAAGSLAALATLVMAIAISALALAPWPTWWRVQIAAAGANERPAIAIAPVSALPVKQPVAAPALSSHPTQLSSSNENGIRVDTATWARTFWTTFWNDLRNQPAIEAKPGRHWPTIAAWLLLGGMMLGFARLLLGLAAVGRCRRRTRPIAEATLNELLDATRARLACRRPIELRESGEIVSPATVGWRRPIILLPKDWREWSEGELQVVLAHEAAHVSRGDFLGALVSQFTVALHFYNPLVHWLAGQLRIEQELAADAWGATLAGGNTAYLTTLAGMALRQDDRTTIWAARQFLPARGTLLRRIEMLRDHKQPGSFTFSKPKQFAVWGGLIALGLFVAGLRGPSGTTGVAEAAPPNPTLTPYLYVFDKDAKPPDGTSAPVSGTLTLSNGGTLTINVGSAAAQAREPIGLDYVPPESAFVVGVREDGLMASPAIQLMLHSIPGGRNGLETKIGFPIADIDYVTYASNDFDGDWPIITLHMKVAHDFHRIISEVVGTGKLVIEESMATTGKTVRFYRTTNNSKFICVQPDERTLIALPEKLRGWTGLLNPLPTPKWAKLWDRGATGTLAVMLNVGEFRRETKLQIESHSGILVPLVAMLGPAWNDSEFIIAGADLRDQKLGLLVLDQCNSNDSAPQVEQTCKALITLGLNGLEAARQIGPHDTTSDVMLKQMLVNTAEQLLKAVTVSHDGDTVAIKSQGDGAVFLAVASVIMPAVAKSRDSAQRVHSINNLKQLAIAMYQYEEKNGHFPPAVVMGPDGKMPHSWRVELLPYLDEYALYKQYKMHEPWDSPDNKKVLEAEPEIFHSGADSGPATNADYFVLAGKDAMFSGKDGIKLQEITGGTSNTIMIVEAKRDIPWTKPEDIDYNPTKPLPELGLGGKVFAAAFADGSVRMLDKDVNEQVLKAFIGITAADKVWINSQHDLGPR